jgi:phage head maturation protease
MTETREARASWLHARFAPTSFDADARTVEVVWSTGASVRRRDWDGEFIEELAMTPDAVDLSRLSAGAPVLAAHDAFSLNSVLGVVERAWLEGGEGRALLRFSDRAEVAPVLSDIRNGILRNISVGYDVMKWEESKDKAGKRTKRAVRWQPAEISLVPIPADASAQVRAAEMPDAETRGHGEDDFNMEGRMADNAPQVPDAPAPTINRDQIAHEARAAERARVAELRSFVSLAQRQEVLPAEVLSEMEQAAIEEGASVDALRSRVMDKVLASPVRAPAPRPIQMGASGDDPAALVDAMGDAIAKRSLPMSFSPRTDRFREFAGMRPSEMLMELAQARGERVSPRDRQRLMERAFHTSSDFPMLLENAGNKMLEAGFAAAEPTYRRFFANRPFNDFKQHTFLTAGDFPALAALAEGGEITAGTISEKRERITAQTYARQVRVTRQMLVNDDLGAFTDFGAMIGRRVADQENALAYAVLNTASGAGPTLLEGNAAVFTTAKNNRAAAGAAIDATTLDTGFAAIMEHTSLDGLKLNLSPRYVVTGSAYRGPALRFTRGSQRVVPEAGANVPLYDTLEPIADANIPGNRWYLMPDPAAAPIYVYGYVNGQTAPMVRVHQYVPGTDGIAIEVVHDFAVGAVGWRGGWFNPGA